MKNFFLPSLAFLVLFSACVYEPEQFVENDSDKPSVNSDSEIGTVYTINGQKQICNPSVSQDTVNYPASMLWLGFGGTLNVTSKDSGYKTTGAIQHDRLTVTDEKNEVRWYLMVDTAAGECQFQDPEWSTHPDFLVSLRGYDTKGEESCDNLDYGIFAVRMSDKKKFWFVEKGVGEFGTPHLWVDPSAIGDTSAEDSSVAGFFGTENVRLVYVNPQNEIVFADYAHGGLEKSIKLKKSEEMEDWMVDSPMISPDGNFIVFNVIDDRMTSWKSFIQKLSGNSTPQKIEVTSDMTGEPVQPRWFQYGSRLFVLWTEFPSGSQFLNKNNLADVSVQDGSAGRTAMREISLDGSAPSDIAMQWLGSVTEVAPVPMIGGRSPDGRYLATGTNNGYILELP